MTPILQALLLGTIQGLTEFLPVSSKSHLALAGNLVGLPHAVAFFVLLHLGTLVAVALAFPQRLANLAVGLIRLPRALFRPLAEWSDAERLAAGILLSAVPGGLAGLLLQDYIEAALERPLFVGIGLLGTAALLWSTRRARRNDRPVGLREAALIGLAQAFAVLPGISRSGTTIAAALLLGVRRGEAAEFSFIASVPLILGAGLLEVRHMSGVQGMGPLELAVGFLTSALVGWLAVVWLAKLVRAGALHWFAPYCLLLGIGVLVTTLLR